MRFNPKTTRGIIQRLKNHINRYRENIWVGPLKMEGRARKRFPRTKDEPNYRGYCQSYQDGKVYNISIWDNSGSLRFEVCDEAPYPDHREYYTNLDTDIVEI
jgi:hypothetical protein